MLSAVCGIAPILFAVQDADKGRSKSGISFFFFQAEDGIRDHCVTGVQTCALPISTVLKPGRTFEVLATNDLEDGFMASPAVSGKALFLRTKTHLYRVEEGAGK